MVSLPPQAGQHGAPWPGLDWGARGCSRRRTRQEKDF
jgi:hypothetical protein